MLIKSEKLLNAVKVLGCGLDKTFDINKLKYHKIIIMADADCVKTVVYTVMYKIMSRLTNFIFGVQF